MSNILSRSLIVALVSLVGCVPASVGFSSSASPAPRGGYGGGGPRASSAPTRVEVENAYGPGEDRHWFSDDDYLVSKQPYQGALIRYLHVAKMLVTPSEATRSEAKFLVANGHEQWTAHFFQTRVATSADLVVGNVAFCRADYERVAEAPRRKSTARQQGWVIAPITDNADLYKGFVTVGKTSCEASGVRVLR